MATRPKKQPKTPTTSVVGSNVYRLRVLKPEGSWSRKKLATLAGVSEETIRLLEQNRIPGTEQLSPHMDTVDRLATALGVDPDTLYQQATPSKPTGQPRHLRSIPGTGGALPAKR